MVREAVGSAIPQPRKKTERPRFKLMPIMGFIDQILESDRKAPRKQRHTAYRIWRRICAELPEHKVCERTVRSYVQERKMALGLAVHETFVPQSYPWGVEAQVDFHEPAARCQWGACFFSVQTAAAVVLLKTRLPFAFFGGICLMHIGVRTLSRCCQLVHGLEDPIDLRSHR
jgi:hypothetical protein